MSGTKKQADKEYSENWGGKRENSGNKGGFHGGGRKPTGRKYKTFSFSCSPEQYDAIKAKIDASGLKPSHFFVKMCLGDIE